MAMHPCIYVCTYMYVCIYVCMYVCMCVCLSARIFVSIELCFNEVVVGGSVPCVGSRGGQHTVCEPDPARGGILTGPAAVSGRTW